MRGAGGTPAEAGSLFRPVVLSNGVRRMQESLLIGAPQADPSQGLPHLHEKRPA
jgi:hypothetical protein